MSLQKQYKRQFHWLAWSKPGGEEIGRVMLALPHDVHDPEPFSGRTVEDVTIPEGCVLKLVVTDDEDPFLH